MHKIQKSVGFVSIAAFWAVVAIITHFNKESNVVLFGVSWAAILTAIVLAGINWSGKPDHRKAS